MRKTTRKHTDQPPIAVLETPQRSRSRRRTCYMLFAIGCLILGLISLFIVTSYAADDDETQIVNFLMDANFPQSNFLSYIGRSLGWTICKGLAYLVNGISYACQKIGQVIDVSTIIKKLGLQSNLTTITFVLLTLVLLMAALLIMAHRAELKNVAINLLIGLCVFSIFAGSSAILDNLYKLPDAAMGVITGENDSGNANTDLGTTNMAGYTVDILQYDKTYPNLTGIQTLADSSSADQQKQLIETLDPTETIDPDDSSYNIQNKDVFGKKVIIRDGKLALSDKLWNGTIPLINLHIPFLSEQYYRWKIDWFPMIVSMLALAFALLFTAIKIARILFELIIKQFLVQVLSLTDMVSGQKLKQALQSFLASLVTLFGCNFMLLLYTRCNSLIMRLMNENFPGIDQAVLRGFLTVIIQIALAWAVIDGPAIFEKLFGIDVGLNNPLRTLFAFQTAAHMAGGAKRGIMGTVGADGHRHDGIVGTAGSIGRFFASRVSKNKGNSGQKKSGRAGQTASSGAGGAALPTSSSGSGAGFSTRPGPTTPPPSSGGSAASNTQPSQTGSDGRRASTATQAAGSENASSNARPGPTANNAPGTGAAVPAPMSSSSASSARPGPAGESGAIAAAEAAAIGSAAANNVQRGSVGSNTPGANAATQTAGDNNALPNTRPGPTGSNGSATGAPVPSLGSNAASGRPGPMGSNVSGANAADLTAENNNTAPGTRPGPLGKNPSGTSIGTIGDRNAATNNRPSPMASTNAADMTVGNGGTAINDRPGPLGKNSSGASMGTLSDRNAATNNRPGHAGNNASGSNGTGNATSNSRPSPIGGAGINSSDMSTGNGLYPDRPGQNSNMPNTPGAPSPFGANARSTGNLDAPRPAPFGATVASPAAPVSPSSAASVTRPSSVLTSPVSSTAVPSVPGTPNVLPVPSAAAPVNGINHVAARAFSAPSGAVPVSASVLPAAPDISGAQTVTTSSAPSGAAPINPVSRPSVRPYATPSGAVPASSGVLPAAPDISGGQTVTTSSAPSGAAPINPVSRPSVRPYATPSGAVPAFSGVLPAAPDMSGAQTVTTSSAPSSGAAPISPVSRPSVRPYATPSGAVPVSSATSSGGQSADSGNVPGGISPATSVGTKKQLGSNDINSIDPVHTVTPPSGARPAVKNKSPHPDKKS